MSKFDVRELLQKMWEDYVGLNPHVLEIHNIFVERGDDVYNDHIAIRTYNHPKVCVDVLARPFLKGGYKEAGNYRFEEKKLNAKHFEHEDESLPKVFISELRLEEFDQELNDIVTGLIDQIPDGVNQEDYFPVSKRVWDVSHETYEKLLEKSEYAAWVAAFGFRANHFTVYVNKLKSLDNLKDLNEVVRENGFLINESGGEVKGSKEVYLEQSSTLAGKIDLEFSGGKMYRVPACYYEFALRYPLENGKLFQGFVAKSADKIFESTDVHR
ncbi:MAG: DUF1338 domain-containing protein [Cytophagales bacterium]|nr:DUF1338 domain-containing protein [Cytophagales bacterium]